MTHDRGGRRGTLAREWISRQFTHVEDVVYVGLGILLAAGAAALLVEEGGSFAAGILSGHMMERIVPLLDRILLLLIVTEILYTVQVSFREHTLLPEPFLIVGLIAVIRRVLIVTAGIGKLVETGDPSLRNVLLELGLLTVLVIALVVSLRLLQARPPRAVAERA